MSRFRLTSPKLKLTENDVRKACLDALWARGWWPIRQHVGLFTTPNQGKVNIGEPGDPDYVIVKPPSFFLETKRPGGKLSAVQRERINVLHKCYGLETAVVESVEELIAWLGKRAGGITGP